MTHEDTARRIWEALDADPEFTAAMARAKAERDRGEFKPWHPLDVPDNAGELMRLIARHNAQMNRCWAEATHAALAAVRERVEAMIETSGGRCVAPADYDRTDINICEAHSEILFEEDGCSDQPRHLLAVLAILDDLENTDRVPARGPETAIPRS